MFIYTLHIECANNSWNRLKEVELGFDVKSGKEYDFRVEKIGNAIEVFVEGKLYIKIQDSKLNVDGCIGLRGWKANVDYVSFSAEKVPF
jgi:hypothetical protein